MAKIDLISLSALTANDGSIIASGATVKFNSEFSVRSTAVMIRPKIYRSRELFEAGYTNVMAIEIPDNFQIQLTEEDFYTLTPAKLYEKVRDYLNDLLSEDMFEINIIN
jgi:hypothetical protein